MKQDIVQSILSIHKYTNKKETKIALLHCYYQLKVIEILCLVFRPKGAHECRHNEKSHTDVIFQSCSYRIDGELNLANDYGFLK